MIGTLANFPLAMASTGRFEMKNPSRIGEKGYNVDGREAKV